MDNELVAANRFLRQAIEGLNGEHAYIFQDQTEAKNFYAALTRVRAERFLNIDPCFLKITIEQNEIGVLVIKIIKGVFDNV